MKLLEKSSCSSQNQSRLFVLCRKSQLAESKQVKIDTWTSSALRPSILTLGAHGAVLTLRDQMTSRDYRREALLSRVSSSLVFFPTVTCSWLMHLAFRKQLGHLVDTPLFACSSLHLNSWHEFLMQRIGRNFQRADFRMWSDLSLLLLLLLLLLFCFLAWLTSFLQIGLQAQWKQDELRSDSYLIRIKFALAFVNS